MRRLLVVFAVIIAAVFVPQSSSAQSALCFNIPGITNCIDGRFREFWEQNGSLPVFGYPITPVTNEQTPDGTFATQYFERNRFELHPEQPRPYDVLLGRLGDVRLKQQGRDWTTFPKGTQASGCLWFADTGHRVCEPFMSYYERYGLQDPALDPAARSLALFGMPLSEPAYESNAAGSTVLTQWFERARFEYHPRNPAQIILLGLLGNEIRDAPQTSPQQPTPMPPPTAPNACVNIAAPQDAIIEPNCVPYGETLEVVTYGWDAGQPLGFWITDHNGTTVGTSQTVNADEEGRFGGTIDTLDWFGLELHPGDYNFVVGDARNVPPSQLYQDSIAPFRVISGSTPPPSNPPPAQPTPTPRPQPTPTSPPPARNCDAAYPTVCIPPPPPDLDCPDISYRNFTVREPDPHRFDNDNDGTGCEE